MAKGVTIKDVAAEAGVSFKTVSNVINGTGSMRESTRGRVLEAMDKLNYTINLSARSLKTGTTGLLGLAIFDFSPAIRLVSGRSDHRLRAGASLRGHHKHLRPE